MKPRVARLLPPTPACLAEAGAILRDGGLCAFPTETVYGLGANALNETAVRRIFEVKQRPLSDPLIVHVASCAEALELVELGENGGVRRAFEVLTARFWPGPLTLVCEARPHLPACLSAGTQTVGVRCPSHALALALLRAARVPVAAPSANVFGHVSPTASRHVLDDLGEFPDLVVLDGESEAPGAPRYEPVCEHGIESTVCKLEEDNAADGAVLLRIYRRGAISKLDLEAAMRDACGNRWRFVEGSLAENSENVNAEAPGQLLTHYAPRLPCYLATVVTTTTTTTITTGDAAAAAPDPDPDDAEKATVVVDYNGRLAALESGALAYRDLSRDADARQAANGLFDALRWAEAVPGANTVLVADLSSDRTSSDILASVADRLYRAASGKRTTRRILRPRK